MFNLTNELGTYPFRRETARFLHANKLTQPRAKFLQAGFEDGNLGKFSFIEQNNVIRIA